MGIADGLTGVIRGALNQGGVPTPDLTALFQTIDNAGENQRQLINNLPAEVQKQYADYKAANAAAGTALQTGTTALGQNLMAQTEANYDPNAPAVTAAEDAAKTAIYANIPGQQNAIRQALAATGGFDRGTAGKQLAAPVLQAGQQYGQKVADITASQLQQKQQATQQAINTINSMDNNVLQQQFGMSKDQALTLLNSNRQDLKDQMTELVNQSVTQTNQKLGVQSAQINNQYQADVAAKAQSDAMNNAWANVGSGVVSSMAGDASGIAQGLGTSTPYSGGEMGNATGPNGKSGYYSI
jgi:hypothetical protein